MCGEEFPQRAFQLPIDCKGNAPYSDNGRTDHTFRHRCTFGAIFKSQGRIQICAYCEKT
jgi:hypothetical protein